MYPTKFNAVWTDLKLANLDKKEFYEILNKAGFFPTTPASTGKSKAGKGTKAKSGWSVFVTAVSAELKAQVQAKKITPEAYKVLNLMKVAGWSWSVLSKDQQDQWGKETHPALKMLLEAPKGYVPKSKSAKPVAQTASDPTSEEEEVEEEEEGEGEEEGEEKGEEKGDN